MIARPLTLKVPKIAAVKRFGLAGGLIENSYQQKVFPRTVCRNAIDSMYNKIPMIYTSFRRASNE